MLRTTPKTPSRRGKPPLLTMFPIGATSDSKTLGLGLGDPRAGSYWPPLIGMPVTIRLPTHTGLRVTSCGGPCSHTRLPVCRISRDARRKPAVVIAIQKLANAEVLDVLRSGRLPVPLSHPACRRYVLLLLLLLLLFSSLFLSNFRQSGCLLDLYAQPPHS